MDSLCEAARTHIGKRPTRQSLFSHHKINQAFTDKKERLKVGSKDQKTPPSLAIAGQRIERLQEENARLKKENSRLLEQFLIWQYNAYRNGLTKDVLNCPLPSIDRDSSE